MFISKTFQFLLFSAAISANVRGASVDVVDTEKRVTLQDFKAYIQPILYQKFLRAPGDSQVVQRAKIVVSEYLADSLVESVKVPLSQPPESLRPSGKQAANNTGGGASSAGTNIVQGGLGGSGSGNRTRPSSQHVINQVDSILQNVNGANITGIVDQALLIRAPAPVRQLVNGIMNLVLCNPFNRLWNRCSGGGNIFFGNRR